MWIRRIMSRFLNRFSIPRLRSMKTAVADIRARASRPKMSPSMRPNPLALNSLTDGSSQGKSLRDSRSGYVRDRHNLGVPFAFL